MEGKELDVSGWRGQGLPLTTPSEQAARALSRALNMLYMWAGDPIQAAQEAAKADPDFALAFVFLSAMELLGTGSRPGRSPTLDQYLARMKEALKNRPGSPWEAMHVEAIDLFARGHLYSAASQWDTILASYPLDPLALRFASDMYFYLGESYQIRDNIARVLPHWKPLKGHPLYGYVFGMYAFGLEECNQYREAEQNALQALEINRTDCWATHARAHVIEMEGRTDEGIRFLEGTVRDWENGGGLACHNYWHLALYYLQKRNHEAALRIFDQEVNVRKNSGAVLDLVDASSLLFRLELYGVNVGNRWGEVRAAWRPHHQNHITAFNDAHITMGWDPAQESFDSWLSSIEAYTKEGEGGPGPIQTNQFVTKRVGLSLSAAIADFKSGKYSSCVQRLFPARYDIHMVGGSHAQRDVFHQLLLEASIRSGEPPHLAIARALINERAAAKPNCGLVAEYAAHLQSPQAPRH